MVLILAINLVVLTSVIGVALLTPSAPALPPPAGITRGEEALRTASASPTATPTRPVPSPTALTTPVPTRTAAAQASFPGELGQGSLVLSFADNTYAHLFAYQPQTLPFARLTDSPWDDITPALSPDGSRVAYASRQNGYWDLFVLNLADGRARRITDTGDSDRSPAWSPDGKFLAFETYTAGHSQIAMISTDAPGSGATYLTTGSSENYSPAWSPAGRKIAFISSNAGKYSLLVADLDQGESALARPVGPVEKRLLHPAWSPDGSHLAWGEVSGDGSRLVVWNAGEPDRPPAAVGSGDWPVWSPDGKLLAARISTPNRDFLAAYGFPGGQLVLPPQPLPARLLGLDWKVSPPLSASPAWMKARAGEQPTPVWQDQAAPIAIGADTRYGLANLDGVSAPNPQLSDRVDESFRALRQRLTGELGWDFLALLENAFQPITSPLPPGMESDWLYTGRAVRVGTAPLAAGWMVVAREDYAGQTYWRVYLKTRYQDGSQGQPVEQLAWDIASRSGGDPLIYEQGGTPEAAFPAGYWIDFTEFAARFGWERVPALPNWRSYYPGMRFNEFARKDGLSWVAAMLELYPPEALSLPAAPPPSATPAPGRKASPATPTITPTRRPTWTPLPGS